LCRLLLSSGNPLAERPNPEEGCGCGHQWNNPVFDQHHARTSWRRTIGPQKSFELRKSGVFSTILTLFLENLIFFVSSIFFVFGKYRLELCKAVRYLGVSTLWLA